MTALVLFLAALAAIVVVAIAVNRIRGVSASWIESWAPEPGERRLLDDPRADFYAVPRLGQARKMSFARLHRTHAVVTDARIVIAARALLSRRHMITHVIHLDPGDEAPPELAKLSGGLFTKGFETLSARRSELSVVRDGAKEYLRIVPEQTASGAMTEHCRLYSDRAPDLLAAAEGST